MTALEHLVMTMSARPHLRLVTEEHVDEHSHGDLGQEPDLEGLYRRYAPYVATIAFRITGRDNDVDDLVSETFVEAIRSWHKLDRTRSLKGWLATVVTRAALKRLRRRRLRRRLGLEYGEAYEHVASPDASPEHRALLSAVYATLGKLPPEARVAWTLRYIDGEQIETIALRLEMSPATVKRRIASARARLEKEFSDD